MAFTLHPATLEDAEDITRVFQESFKDDHIMGHFYPHTPKHIKWERDLALFKGFIADGETYGGRITKVVETSTGKIVAFSRWQYPYTVTPEQQAEKDARDLKMRQYPEGANTELLDEFFTQLRAGREKFIVPEKTYFLHILAVDPAYQRRGIGTMLIRPGLEAADKAGAQTYIEASSAGLPLYLKHGWEPVGGMTIDMRPHGGHGVEVQKSLMREPHAPSKLEKVLG